MSSERISQQIQFVLEIDKLKQVLRQTKIMGGQRQENSAEHSWQLAVMALVLAEHANEPVDPLHVVSMLLIHDVIEIDAGDTWSFDDKGYVDKEEREKLAADRIFSLLPEDQARPLRALWDEFEKMQTPESRFANALDRLMPMLHNFHNGGGTWRRDGVTMQKVLARQSAISRGSQALGDYSLELLEQARKLGIAPSE
ncbi:MAG TPA: HD domain-containing protein [Symbiobacteriaceae bacterium]|nr:HD domain-containing protein [Symbiobacteriaceae bacterium]